MASAYDDDFPLETIVIVEDPWGMMDEWASGWSTACTGMGCQMYLSEMQNQWNQDLINDNIQMLDDMEASLGVAVADKDETCGNGYTPRQISDAMVSSLGDLAEANSSYGHLIDIEATGIAAYYSGILTPWGSTTAAAGYKIVMGALMSHLNSSATARLTEEYGAAMSTCR